MRQELVGRLFPACRPDELEPVFEPEEPLSGPLTYAVEDPIDPVEIAGRGGSILVTEETYYAVHVDE